MNKLIASVSLLSVAASLSNGATLAETNVDTWSEISNTSATVTGGMTSSPILGNPAPGSNSLNLAIFSGTWGSTATVEIGEKFMATGSFTLVDSDEEGTSAGIRISIAQGDASTPVENDGVGGFLFRTNFDADPSNEYFNTVRTNGGSFLSSATADSRELVSTVSSDGSWNTNTEYTFNFSVERVSEFVADVKMSVTGPSFSLVQTATDYLATDEDFSLDTFAVFFANSGDIDAAEFSNVQVSVVVEPVVPVDLYLLAGQSNMSGRVASGYTPNPDVDEDILYYYRSDGPKPFQDRTSGGEFVGLGPLDTGGYGPEIAIGRALHARSSNKIAIVKTSDGGTSLGVHWDSRASSDNVMWNNWVYDTTDALNKLRGLGYEPVLKGICWLQGESDATDVDRANGYEARFGLLIADMFSHLSSLIDVSGVRFVTARIAHGLHGDIVRSAQSSVMDSNVNWRYFDTLGLSTFDGVHFDEQSVATIAERFVEHLLAPSTISISSAPDQTVFLSFSGILYSSSNLDSWSPMDPQPASPYQVTPAGGRIFFRSERK